MRSRLLSLALGAAVALTTAPLLATPALAAPAVPTPVEIGAPIDEYARDTAWNTAAFMVWAPGISAQTFVATESGPVTAASQAVWAFAGTLSIYAADQFSNEAGSSLTPVPNSVFSAGTPLGTASFGTGPGEISNYTLYTRPFDKTINLVKGNTYWLVERIANGEPIRYGTSASTSGVILANGNTVALEFAVRLHFDADFNRTRVPIGVTLTGTAGEDGWYRSDVAADYTCFSTVTDCPEPATISTQGANSPSGTVHDGDRAFAWFHDLKVDSVPPSITGSSKRQGTGFTVTWSCNDATSGVAQCPAPTYVSGIGDDTVATGTATDNAGNTATGTVTKLVASKYAPKVTIKGVTAGKTYKHGTKLTPACTAAHSRPATVRQRAGAPKVTCTGKTTSKKNKNGSVSWTYTATAVDRHPLGGTTTKSVSWKVAAKPARLTVEGLPSTTKNGYPVIDHRKVYDVSFVFRDADGKKLTGKPTWLHSVTTDVTGKKGTPTVKAAVQFTKVNGVWTKKFTPDRSYKDQYRKFGVIAPDGKRHYVVVYVK